MDLLPEELSNLGALLASADESNILLGLSILEEHPQYAENLICQLMLLKHFYKTDNAAFLSKLNASVNILLKKNVQESILDRYNGHFIPFNWAFYYNQKPWSKFYPKLEYYNKNAHLYEPFIFGNPIYIKAYVRLAQYLRHYCHQPVQAHYVYKKIISNTAYDFDLMLTYCDMMVNDVFITEQCLEELPMVIKVMEEAASRNINYAADYYNILGILYDIYVLDKEKGKEYYYKVLAINPHYGASLNNLANILYKFDGNFEEALQLAELANEVERNDTHNMDTLACILWKGFNRLDEAEAIFRKIYEQTHSHHPSQTGLGEVLEAKGLFEEALEWYEKGLEMRPNSEFKLTKIADLLYLKLNRPKEALHYYVRLNKIATDKTHARKMRKEIQDLLK